MLRERLNEFLQKKFFLMFFTCLIYILGLWAYFSHMSVFLAGFLLLVGIFAILRNLVSPGIVLFWYLIFFFAFFNASLRIKNSDELYKLAPQNASIEAKIASIPSENGSNKIKFFANVDKITYPGGVKEVNAKTLVTVAYAGKKPEFDIGNTYIFEGKLRAPFEVSNPSQFDYGKYLRNFDTFSLFYSDKFEPLESKLSLKWKFLQKLNNTRNDILETHSKYLKSPNLELLGGMVFGDDAVATPEGLKNSFRYSGLLHLLAASGLNVALIYGIWFFLSRKLRLPFNFCVLSGIFVIIFYSFMTGLGPSVIRAAIMLIFILVGKLLDRDAHSLSLLSFVALLMLIYNPSYINDVSFQLSFIVTFGLLLMMPVVLEKTKNLPNWLSGALFVPLIAQIWVAPIQMFYFNSFTLYSVFANIIILPFVTVVSFGGFLSAVLALLKPVANQVCFVFDFVLNPFLNIIVAVSDFFAGLPHALVQTSQPNSLQIGLYYSIVFLATLLIQFGKNKKVIMTLAAVFLMLLASFIPFKNGKLETIAFDVQNADAFLIKTPKDKYFLIDSGKMSYKGGKTQAQMIILNYLKDKGIKNIEALIITHFDSDHAGGAVDLIENLNIKTIYVNSLDDNSRLAQEIYKIAKNKLKVPKNNEIVYNEGNLSVRMFEANFKGGEFDNENSIITLVSDGDFGELFMGDAGILAFDEIKNSLPGKVEILKVGHHGAKNVVNKRFLERIKPEVAIISTGINNYGHPNGVTLDLLKSQNVKILRTDRQSAIKIEEKDGKYNDYSFYKGKFLLR